MALYDPVQQDEEDVARYGNDYGPAVSAPVVAPPSVAAPGVVPPGRLGDQYSQMQASDAEIGAASAQLGAGQPVTALPRQSWSPAQAQSFSARLDQFDQQAKAARQAAEQAAIAAQMYDQMSRVAQSTKDIAIAKQTIDTMAYQQAASKMPPDATPAQWAALVMQHPGAVGGGGVSAAMKALTPVTQPQFVPTSAITGPGHFVDSQGHVHIAPETGGPPDTEGRVLKDPETQKRVGIAYSTGPRSQRVVLDALDKGITPAIANQIYSSQERGLMHELSDIEARAAILDDKNPKHQYFVDVQNQLKQVREERKALIHGAAPAAPSAAPVKVTSKAERDALASGTRYIGPDGRLAIKQ